MTAAPDLSILVVSWNVRERVLACLASLACDNDAPSFEVIVVDNGSTDGTVEAVRSRFPHVVVIANERNVGFPRANNQALALASGRYVLYLNPDTEVVAGTLRACMTELDTHPDIGIAGCRLEGPDGTIQYDGARRTYHVGDLMFEILYLHVLFPRSPFFRRHLYGDWDHRGMRDVEAVCGAFMMTPRALAVAIGGLPEDVFMYHEDLSFCLRVFRMGYRIRYCGDVAIVHHGGQSSGRSGARFGLLEIESKYRYVEEADGQGWASIARVLLLMRAVVRLGICAAGTVLPQRLQCRYPRVFDWRTHGLQLYWCVARERAMRFAPGPERWDMAAAGPATQGAS
jgi:GT2 family glycosyltransferase